MSDSAASSRRDSGHDVGAPLLPPDLDAIERLVAAIEDPDEGADEAQGTGHQAQERGPSEGAQPADQRAPSASWGADPDDEPLPRIDGYRVIERLGAGGGGEVFRAVRDGAERHVAIKLVRARPGRTPGAGRAWRELDVFADLRLDCMPRVLDFGAANGRLYIATELIAGEPLDAAAEGLDRRERVELLARVADGVQQLHEHGVIHRDIKPSNVLVDEAGKPFIIDLGVASLLASDVMETLTAEGAPIGTPAFMAPEQARGDRKKVSIRSDVYALGATALYVITGHGPHEVSGSLHEQVHRVAYDPPREPRAIDPTLPKRLAAVLAKATDSDPDRRYASAREFADDLRRWLRGDPVEATPPGVVRKLGRRVARHPVLTTTVCSVLIAVIVVGGTIAGTAWAQSQPRSVELFQGKTLRVWSAGGTVIDKINTDQSGNIKFMLDDLDQGGRTVIAGFSLDSDSPYAGLLCAFDAHNLGEPFWTATPVAVPDDLLYANAGKNEWENRAVFSADFGVLIDLPEHTGLEIAVAHNHGRWSQTSIRVYSMRGEVLGELWHDGRLRGLKWLPDHQMLVAVGVNSDGDWSERGIPQPLESGMFHPWVVFALDASVLSRSGIIEWPGNETFATIDPLWYGALLPPEHAQAVKPSRAAFIPPTIEQDKQNTIWLNFESTGDAEARPQLLIQMGLDGRIERIPESLTWDAFGPGFSPDELVLGEMPARQTPRRDPQD